MELLQRQFHKREKNSLFWAAVSILHIFLLFLFFFANEYEILRRVFFLFFQLSVTYMDVVRYIWSEIIIRIMWMSQRQYKQGEQENTILQTIEKDAKRERETGGRGELL